MRGHGASRERKYLCLEPMVCGNRGRKRHGRSEHGFVRLHKLTHMAGGPFTVCTEQERTIREEGSLEPCGT